MVPYKNLLDLYEMNSEPEPLWVDAIKTYETKKLSEFDYTLSPIELLRKIS